MYIPGMYLYIYILTPLPPLPLPPLLTLASTAVGVASFYRSLALSRVRDAPKQNKKNVPVLILGGDLCVQELQAVGDGAGAFGRYEQEGHGEGQALAQRGRGRLCLCRQVGILAVAAGVDRGGVGRQRGRGGGGVELLMRCAADATVWQLCFFCPSLLIRY